MEYTWSVRVAAKISNKLQIIRDVGQCKSVNILEYANDMDVIGSSSFDIIHRFFAIEKAGNFVRINVLKTVCKVLLVGA